MHDGRHNEVKANAGRQTCAHAALISWSETVTLRPPTPLHTSHRNGRPGFMIQFMRGQEAAAALLALLHSLIRGAAFSSSRTTALVPPVAAAKYFMKYLHPGSPRLSGLCKEACGQVS